MTAARPGEPPAGRAVLVVLDGWGMASDGPGNAIARARTVLAMCSSCEERRICAYWI